MKKSISFSQPESEVRVQNPPVIIIIRIKIVIKIITILIIIITTPIFQPSPHPTCLYPVSF